VIALLQRVSRGCVAVDDKIVGQIEKGIVVLVGVQKHDDASHAQRLVDRLLGYRVFPDATGRMNLSIRDIGGGMLLVPQFTLAADTHKGTRASFTSAAAPGIAQTAFSQCVEYARAQYDIVECGQFGADMQVLLINDGPVTFWLEN
jgi:D-tyrosyl-tRNA(Tyr) deacylase